MTLIAFRQQMQPIREEVKALLSRGYFNPLTRGVCREWWEHRVNLWTFVEGERVEPTNNAAERPSATPLSGGNSPSAPSPLPEAASWNGCGP